MKKDMNKRFFILLALFLVVCSLLVCLIFYLDDSKIEKVNLSNYKENENIVWKINKKSIKNNKLNIEGYAYIKKEKLKSVDCNVVLRNCKTNEELRIPTCIRTVDVDKFNATEVFERFKKSDSYYFISNVSCKKVQLDKNEYEIVIEYKNNNHRYVVNTGEYVK